MRTRIVFAVVALALAGLLVAAVACAPKVIPATQAVREKEAAQAAPMPTAAPAVAQPPAEKSEAQPAAELAREGEQAGPLSAAYVSAVQAERMIVKEGEMTLLVESTERAIDDVTRIAMASGGYILGTDAVLKEGYRYATIKLGVPVEQFEAVQQQLRALAMMVLSETSHGVDVSDEYVDLQSRLVNLDATAARLRTFLDRATTISETLRVNEELATIEADIEKVKGRMNYLRERSSYSTLTVKLEPLRPTATPTLTPTVTPTETPTPTTTPVAWRPLRTARAAGRTLGDILRVIGDIAIWVVTLCAPLAAPFVLLWWLMRRYQQKHPRPPKPPTPTPPAAPKPPSDADAATPK